MKKAIALIALCIALLLFGCPGNGGEPTPTPQPSATPSPSGELGPSDLPGIEEVDDSSDTLPTPLPPDSEGAGVQEPSGLGESDLGIAEGIDDWDALELPIPSSPA